MGEQDEEKTNAPKENCQEAGSFNMEYFDVCLEKAREALSNGEVAIGCLFVDSVTNRVLATNRNRVNETKNATRHAEINCIDDILKNENNICWSNVDVYVTCEPCIQCARILRHLGVRRVIYGCSNDRFGGCRSVLNVSDHSNISSEPPLNYIYGVKSDEAIKLLKTFYEGENLNAPEEMRKIKQLKR